MIGKVTIGNRKYKTTTIGNQEWLAEDLDCKFLYNDTQLPIGVTGNPSTPAAWYYNNDEATYGVNGNKYGLLYNWYAAKYLDDNKSTLLPSGWHLPTSSEWNTLLTTCGGATTCGVKLKSTTGWNSGAGIDDWEFSAFPAGNYNDSSAFVNLGLDFCCWSSSVKGNNNAYFIDMPSTSNRVYTFDGPKEYGASIRLVKTLT